MIPKIIHYVWVGNAPKSDLILRCIESWKKYCPDYEIMEWGNDILQEIDNQYVKEAFEAKKWAFVSDYIRLYVLKKYGGVYLDADVEVKKSFDELLDLDFFIGSEEFKGSKHIGTAVIAAKSNSCVITHLLKTYDGISFINKDGKLDLLSNTIRLITPLKELGFKDVYSDQDPIYLNDKNVIFPVQYFSKDTSSSFTVHHFLGSWVDDFKIKTKAILKFNGRTIKLIKVKRNKKDIKFNLTEKIIYSTDQKKNSFWLITAEKGELI